MGNFKDLEVREESISLTEEIYELTENIPNDEKYGLISQIKRAAVSVPSNIAEGAARKSDKEFCQFLNISLGSLAELETQLIILKRLNYIKIYPGKKLDKIRRKVYSLEKSLR